MKRNAKRILANVISRLSQESTWRGLVGIAAAFGAVMNKDQSEAIIAAGLFVIGCINFGKNK